MSIIVKRFINKPIDSNCFLAYTIENNNCIIIDPGSEDSTEIIEFIKNKEFNPKYIFLTHEHFDHIWGVNQLKTEFDVQLCCSSRCAERIINKKKNLSLFYNQVGFETFPADIIVKNNDQLINNFAKISILETPGHTDSSICILINNHFFTGDTIIEGGKTPVKLPSGNLIELNKSIALIHSISIVQGNTIIHPGHGISSNAYNFFINKI
jgi:glyoxylase-like metal-dependent hydrolase (beta-lactamase superfamily II)